MLSLLIHLQPHLGLQIFKIVLLTFFDKLESGSIEEIDIYLGFFSSDDLFPHNDLIFLHLFLLVLSQCALSCAQSSLEPCLIINRHFRTDDTHETLEFHFSTLHLVVSEKLTHEGFIIHIGGFLSRRETSCY